MSSNHCFKIHFFIVLLTLAFLTQSYLQFTLKKGQQNQQAKKLAQQDDCIGKNNFKTKDDDVNYDQLCYFKDINYYIELFHNNKLHHISIDLTSPYSWLKSQQCLVSQTGDICQLIQEEGNQKQKKHKKHKKSANLDHQQKNSENSGSKGKKDQDDSQQQKNSRLARIQGSNQFVEGYLQQNKQIQFWTKDSGRLSRLFDILMLGFYLVEEKQKVALHKTNFINTTKLSQNMDRLCDGALSLRFDENSQNSFLQQIFEYTQTSEKIITIYVNGKQSTLTIGQLSIKNSALGYSGIVWAPFDQTEDSTAYGKLPLVKSIMLQSLAKDQEEDIDNDEGNNVFAVFSLSASYIGLPQKAINQLVKQFKAKYKLQCLVSPHSYFQCTQSSSHQPSFTQNLLIVMKEGAISLPLSSLVLKKTKKKFTFNLRIISKQQNEKQKSFIILGEPYFQKYFTVLDYKLDKVGFAIKRTAQHNNFISTVALIRFVSFLFFAGCCFLVCFQPLKKMFDTFRSSKSFYSKKSPEGRRLKYQPIEENPYQQVAGTLRKVLQQSEEIQ